MKIFELSIVLLFFAFKSHAIDYGESDFDYPEDNDNYLLNRTNERNFDYYDDSKQVCSGDTLIDKFVNNVLPDDYEEGKQLDFNTKISHLNETISIFKRLHIYSQNVSENMKPIMKRVMPRMSEILLLIELSPECMVSLARVGQAVQDGQLWALKFLDSMPSMSFSSSISGPSIGEYDECLSIESPVEKDKPVIKGQYCSLGSIEMIPPKESYTPGDPIDDYIISLINDHLKTAKLRINPLGKNYFNNDLKSLRIRPELIEEVLDTNHYFKAYLSKLPTGYCLPTTCSPKDVENAVNKLIYPITRVPFVMNPDCDYIGKEVKLNDHQIVSIVTFSVLAFLVIICSIYELIHDGYYKSTRKTLLLVFAQSFSLKTNLKAIFETKVANNRFSSLDGIRAVFCVWMTFMHDMEAGLIPLHTKQLYSSMPFRVGTEDGFYVLFKNANLTDTFFFIGGMMTCYVMLSKLEKSKGKFSYLEYALFRYLRLLPPIAGAILVIYLFPLFGDGPFWKIVSDLFVLPCMVNWLPSILMYNNYDMELPKKYSCNLATWYTSADFQIYLLAPIIFLVIYHKPKIGLYYNILWIILGIFIAVAPKIIFGMPHIFEFQNREGLFSYTALMRHHYWGIETHVVSYAFGMLLGYLIRNKPNLNFGGRYGELFIWIITWSSTVWSFYWNKDYFNPYYGLTQTALLLWMALGRLSYLVGYFWLLYACSTGRGGFINTFLSWRYFKPFSNLSFELYILNVIIVFYRIGVTRDHIFYSDYYLATIIPFDFLATFILSIIVYSLISGPFANLMNNFLKPSAKLEEKAQKNDEIAMEKVVCFNNDTAILKSNDNILN